MINKPSAPATSLATETASPRFNDLDAWDTSTAAFALWEGQLAAVAAAQPALPALVAAVDAAVPRLSNGGRLVYIGAGTSGRLAALDAAELDPTFSWPAARTIVIIAGGQKALTSSIENAEDDEVAGANAIGQHGVSASDVVVALAASGRTPFTCAAAKAARQLDALVIGITNNKTAPLLGLAEHPICLETGAEPIAGSTRMKAGTAQKVVLNLLSTLIMVRLGRVFQGRMVAMRPLNQKLRRRAVRILAEIAECNEDAAQSALAVADGDICLATLMLRRRINLVDARSLLNNHGGALRPALESSEK